MAQQPQPQNSPQNNQNVARRNDRPSTPFGRSNVGPTPVAIGGNATTGGASGPIEEADFANLDSLRIEVVKSRTAQYQIRALEDQINHLQSELRSCESTCEDGSE